MDVWVGDFRVSLRKNEEENSCLFHGLSRNKFGKKVEK